MKLIQQFAVVLLLGLGTTPAWSQAYLQEFTGANAESFSPATGGNVFGADIISAGRQNNGLYLMFNDDSLDNPSNFFLGGYFQRFDVSGAQPNGGLRNFSFGPGALLSVDVSQIPAGPPGNQVINPSPGAGFFALQITFDTNGDGRYTSDSVDSNYRTNLLNFQYPLPGAATTFSVALNAANFQFDPGVAGQQAGAFDLTKTARIGLLFLQNIPENGSQDFANDTFLGWRFDNLSVAAIPEPSTWAMTLIGLVGLAGIMRRRK